MDADTDARGADPLHRTVQDHDRNPDQNHERCLWPTVNLGEVIELLDHRRAPLSRAQRHGRPGPYPYHGAQGILDHIDDFRFSGRHILIAEDGENLYSRKLPLARLVEGKFWVSNHAHVLRARAQRLDERFLLAWLNQADLRPFVTGAAQPKLSQANLRRIAVPLPPLSVQRRSADILAAYEDLIANCRRRIQILHTMAQRLYHEWFVRFRFPGGASAALVSSELGAIPAGWEVGRLQEVVVLQRGFDLPGHKREAGAVPIYAATGIVGSHAAARVKAPGLVTGRSGTIGEVLYVQEDFWPLNTVLWASAFPRSEPLYAYYLLASLRLGQFSSGAAVPTLNRNDVHGLRVLIPPRLIQQRFQRDAGSLLAQVHALTLKIQNLRRACALLLPRLVTRPSR